MERIIKNNKIKFNGDIYIPGYQKNPIPRIGFEKTLKTIFKNGDKVIVNSASSGIGVTKNGIKECWIIELLYDDIIPINEFGVVIKYY